MINLLRSRPWFGSLPTSPADHAASARDTDALFESLVESHYRRTYSLIYRMVRSEQDAADLTQETFVRVYRALPRLRAQGALDAWVRRIATNLCLDYLRRRNSTPPSQSLDSATGPDQSQPMHLEILDPSGEPDRLFATAESARQLHRAIDTLPADYRLVILLHHIEDMRVDEIAAALGVPGGTIKSRLSRARRELRRKLSPFYE